MRIGNEVDASSMDPMHRRVAERSVDHWAQERSENFGLAAAVGLVAALACAYGWAQFSLGTGFRFGAVSILLGLLVGILVRVSGNGWSPRFGYLAAFLAVFACGSGDTLFQAALIQRGDPQISVLDVIATQSAEILATNFSPLNRSWLFYLISALAAYKVGFRD